jgi:hypothetical protein
VVGVAVFDEPAGVSVPCWTGQSAGCGGGDRRCGYGTGRTWTVARRDIEDAEAAVTESRDDEQLAGRLAAVAALGLVLIVPPLLAQFDHMDQIFGVPVLWAYLYLVWAIMIGLVAVIGGRSR